MASFVSPYFKSRKFTRQQATNFGEVYMDSTAESFEKRENIVHYQQARQGELSYSPGVNLEYEITQSPELVIDVDNSTLEQSVEKLSVI